MHIGRAISAVLTLIVSVFAVATAPAKAPARWSVVNQPARVVNGSPVLFRVSTPKNINSISGQWLGHEIAFSLDPERKVWLGFGGVSLDTKPGIYPLELRAETTAGQTVNYQHGIRVQHLRYPRVTVLQVPGRYTAPSPEDLRKIEEDKQLKADLFKTLSAEREWKGAFEPPVKAEISDVFGVQRVFNGAVQSTHQGLDFRVTTGTPVEAVNTGTVLLARPLFFEGNCVVLDHGQGLLTLYLHLSKIDVKEGDNVAKGQELGLSGATGRATGPHLHLAVRWQGVYLNPAGLLALRP